MSKSISVMPSLRDLQARFAIIGRTAGAGHIKTDRQAAAFQRSKVLPEVAR
jgi:hypothetical protein